MDFSKLGVVVGADTVASVVVDVGGGFVLGVGVADVEVFASSKPSAYELLRVACGSEKDGCLTVSMRFVISFTTDPTNPSRLRSFQALAKRPEITTEATVNSIDKLKLKTIKPTARLKSKPVIPIPTKAYIT